MEVRVPDIGDFPDVPVIEIHVAAGDEVSPEDPLVTLESDKATMDVPAPLGGTIKQLRVKLGDRGSEGSGLLTLGGGGAGPDEATPPAREAPPTSAAVTEEPPSASETSDGGHDAQLLV